MFIVTVKIVKIDNDMIQNYNYVLKLLHSL